MTTKEVRNEIKKLLATKHISEVTNGDLTEIRKRTGATFDQVTAAHRYFCYSPQTAKYR